jgi:hypothetical protein
MAETATTARASVVGVRIWRGTDSDHRLAAAEALIRHLRDRSLLFPLAVVLSVAVVAVPPTGNFPLNDDWIHAKAVQGLVETGTYQGHPYCAATLVAQAYWGALFCKLFGFSFVTLRISTLVLALIGAWLLARSALVCGAPRGLALLGAIMVATNPLVLNLSFSFMTDIPFLSVTIVSGCFFLKYFREGRIAVAFWGSFFSVVAFFIRQFAIVLPAAFLVTLLIQWWVERRRPAPAVVSCVIGCWAAAGGLLLALQSLAPRETPLLQSLEDRWQMACVDGIRQMPVALCYMGLFTLPLGVGAFWQVLTRRSSALSRRRLWLFTTFCGGSLLVLIAPMTIYLIRLHLFGRESKWLSGYSPRLPLLPKDYLHDLAIGPSQLPWATEIAPVQLGWWWWPLTFAALAGAGVLFLIIMDQVRAVTGKNSRSGSESLNGGQALFLASWGLLILALAYNPGRTFVFDRYLLPALPPFTLLLVATMAAFPVRKVTIVMATVGCLVVYAFSIVCLQDYMGWNGAAWAAQDRLLNHFEAKPTEIRGTDTFNGWYNSEAYMAEHHSRNFYEFDVTGRGPWVFDDRYVAGALAPREGYQVIDRVSYFSWLGLRQRSLLILERSSENEH